MTLCVCRFLWRSAKKPPDANRHLSSVSQTDTLSPTWPLLVFCCHVPRWLFTPTCHRFRSIKPPRKQVDNKFREGTPSSTSIPSCIFSNRRLPHPLAFSSSVIWCAHPFSAALVCPSRPLSVCFFLHSFAKLFMIFMGCSGTGEGRGQSLYHHQACSRERRFVFACSWRRRLCPEGLQGTAMMWNLVVPSPHWHFCDGWDEEATGVHE